MSVRLHLDGADAAWALVRCELCADINKYPALDAAQRAIRCKTCGYAMDVREQLVADATKRHDLTRELVRKLTAASHQRDSKDVHS